MSKHPSPPPVGTREAVPKPEWIRPKDVPKYFGIGRSRLYDLLGGGKIKTVSLRQRGQKHGTRLISYDSIAAYLEALAGKEEV